jgi:hypothetical protein
VVTSDNDYVGQVRAFLVDEGAITHLVVRAGHLWKLREVTLPIEAISRVESDTMTVSLSRDEIDALPAERVHRGLFHRHEDDKE